MPYLAQNGIPVGSAWTNQATFNWPYNSRQGATKLDCFVNGTDIVVQVLEEKTGFQDDQAQEILLRQGFNSREFPSPFLAWRFKVWSGTQLAVKGTVDMVALA